MKPGGFFKHDVFVPVRFLERSDDLALFVDLTPADLERLAETTGDAHRGPVGPGSGDREDPN